METIYLDSNLLEYFDLINSTLNINYVYSFKKSLLNNINIVNIYTVRF